MGLDALAEFDAGEIAVQQFERIVTLDGGAASACELDQIGAKDGGEGARAGEVGDEDAVEQREAAAVFRQCRGDQDRDVGMQRALVGLQLADPAVAPVPRVLAFPEDRAALRAGRVDDDLVDVGAAHALPDAADVVERECAAENRLQLPFAGFTLPLLRSLLRFPFQVFNLPAHVGELAFLLGVSLCSSCRCRRLVLVKPSAATAVGSSHRRRLPRKEAVAATIRERRDHFAETHPRYRHKEHEAHKLPPRNILGL